MTPYLNCELLPAKLNPLKFGNWKMRYHIFILGFDESYKPTPNFTVPYFWVGHLLIQIFKDRWVYGKMVDSKTGETTITWELTGNILSDGRSHLTVNGEYKP